MSENLKNKKIIFFGTPLFAREILKNLVENRVPISLVITQPSKPAGRKQEIEDSEVKKYSQEKGLRIFESSKATAELASLLEKENADLIVTAAYGTILPKNIIEMPKLGSINVHPSLLPKYRGPSPIQYALLNGEKETATTIMMMDEKMDAGDILAQEKVPIDNAETYPLLEKKLIEKSNRLLLETLGNIFTGKAKREKQDENEATFSKIIKKDAGLIDWKEPAEKIYNRYRAFCQWPKISTFFEDNGTKKRLTLHEISIFGKDIAQLKPGEVGKTGKQIIVGTGEGSLELKTIQIEGKTPMTANQFVMGKQNFIGSILG